MHSIKTLVEATNRAFDTPHGLLRIASVSVLLLLSINIWREFGASGLRNGVSGVDISSLHDVPLLGATLGLLVLVVLLFTSRSAPREKETHLRALAACSGAGILLLNSFVGLGQTLSLVLP